MGLANCEIDFGEECRTAENTAAKIKLIMVDLGSEDYATREAAQKALIEIGTEAKPFLHEGMHSSDPEIAKRSREALHKIQQMEHEKPYKDILEKLDPEGKLKGGLKTDTMKLIRSLEKGDYSTFSSLCKLRWQDILDDKTGVFDRLFERSGLNITRERGTDGDRLVFKSKNHGELIRLIVSTSREPGEGTPNPDATRVFLKDRRLIEATAPDVTFKALLFAKD